MAAVPGRSAVPAALAILAILAAGCKDTGGDPPPGPAPATLSFVLDDSTEVSMTGTGAWPPSGSGVLARMDSSGTVLQVAAYRQTSGKRTRTAGPEPRFTWIFLEVSNPSGIAEGPYLPAVALIGSDIPLGALDSLGFFGVSGSFTLTSVADGRVAGTFSGLAMRPSDSAFASVAGGAFDAPYSTGLLSLEDTGSTGGSIAIAVDTGASPVYSWSGGPVNAVGVARVGSLNSLVWGIVTSGGDSIPSGLMHGVVPAGAFRVANAESTLTAGVAYRVTVSRVGGAYGYREFVP